jgi:4-phospho-D-threonate 3-dehydrogenase / 4-phospho-D-erythronate 3-dehydrogenase
MGDAAGIGPEVVLKSLATLKRETNFELRVIGDLAYLSRSAAQLNLPAPQAEDVIDLANLPPEIKMGADAREPGKAAAEYIVRGVELWRSGEVDAIATAPISKNSIRMGGYDFQGHTEFLAHLTGTTKFAMSFFGGDLRVVLLSTHLPLARAIERVKRDALVDLIEFADAELQRLLKRRIRLAVAGLNPHASENGMFGTEESREIMPAIAACRENGVEVSGPYSPDTIFLRCSRGEFDGVIALYHDQATIPVKALSFNTAVNVTLGLPLIRTSVDHGTAYDIAGRGVAESSSMEAAIRLAADLATQ